MDELLTRIDNSRKAMQTMLIPATKENLAIMFDALNVLEDCFRFMFESAQTVQKDGAENA